jgi:hypothetical protein
VRRRVEPELLLLTRRLDLVAVEDERRNTRRPWLRRVRACEEEHGPTEAAVRDPLLRPGDRPAVAVLDRRRTQRAGIRSRLRLGEREGADLLAARERWHEVLLLLVGAEGEYRQRDRTRVDGDRHTDARVGSRKLLEHEDVADKVGAGTPVLLRNAHAEQARLAELRQQLPREAVRAVPRRRLGRDPLIGELPGDRLDLTLLRCQLEVHQA